MDFSPAFGVITLTAKTVDNQLRFTVRDHGPGIPDYALGKIFDKFFSLQRPDGGKKSTGLGLNFVKEVAVLHHGDAIVENHPETGARSVFTIPLRQST